MALQCVQRTFTPRIFCRVPYHYKFIDNWHNIDLALLSESTRIIRHARTNFTPLIRTSPFTQNTDFIQNAVEKAERTISIHNIPYTISAFYNSHVMLPMPAVTARTLFRMWLNLDLNHTAVASASATATATVQQMLHFLMLIEHVDIARDYSRAINSPSWSPSLNDFNDGLHTTDSLFQTVIDGKVNILYLRE